MGVREVASRPAPEAAERPGPESPRVLAAIDASGAARPVLAAARALAAVLGARVHALHVDEGANQTAGGLANAAGVPLAVLRGEVGAALAARATAGDVAAVAVGARGFLVGPRPAGHVALHLLRRSAVPVLVVAPDAQPAGAGFGRVLVPLGGSEESAAPLRGVLADFERAGSDLVGLHVFDAGHPAPLEDHGAYEASAVTAAVARTARFSPGVPIVLRHGWAPEHVPAVAREEEADLIVLSWSRRLADGRADVVRQVLALARVPVLLLPRAARPVVERGAPRPQAGIPRPCAGGRSPGAQHAASRRLSAKGARRARPW